MSQTIENRIVEMQFENKQFESGVQESLSTLDKLKRALKFDDASKNLENFGKATKNFNLNDIGENVEKIGDKFSVFGAIGFTALQRLTNAAIDAGKSMFQALNAPLQQIKSGGWARAMNIEDAKFQIEGLKKSWGALYDDIDYAVSGTAYGFDSAAKAAAQLSASGIEAGDSMKLALRGISGVAAMANASYEEISPIFTTVAGQGKLMTMQLRQLESRGINAAATLGEQLGKSEAQIRDMVSKGKIDFETFSKAMDDAFGEHAKDANKTFQGSLSNIKAALSRIGAEFATPIIHGSIPVFNEIRLFINEIKKSMGPIFEVFSKITEITSGKLVKGIQNLKYAIFQTDAIVHIGNSIKNVFTAVVRIIAAVSDAFGKVFPKTSNFVRSIESVTEGIERFSQKLVMNDSALVGFRNVMVIIFNIFKSMGTILKNILPIVGKVASIVLKIISIIVSLVAHLTTVITKLDVVQKAMDKIREAGGLFAFVVDKLRDAFAKLKDILTDTSTVTGQFATKVKEVASVVAYVVVGLLYSAFSKIRDVIKGFDFHDPLGSLVKGFKNLTNNIKQLSIVEKVMNGIHVALGAVGIAITTVMGLFTKLADSIKSLFTPLSKDKIIEESVEIPIANAGSAMVGVEKTLSKTEGTVKKTANTFTKAKNSITGFADSVIERLTSIKIGEVLLFSFGAALVITTLQMGKFLSSLSEVTSGFKGFVGALTDFVKDFGKKHSTFLQAMLGIAAGIAALAGALWVLSTIDRDKLIDVTISLGSLIAIIGLSSILTSKLGKGANGFAASMAAFAGGIAVLVASIIALDRANLQNLERDVEALVVICGSLLIAAGILSKLSPKFLAGGLAIMAFAGGVYTLAKALNVVSHADLTNIKNNWQELVIVILAFSTLAAVASNVGIGAALGIMSFIAVLKLAFGDLENVKKYFGSIENAFEKIADSIKNALRYFYNAFKQVATDVEKCWPLAGVLKGFLDYALAFILGPIIAIGFAGKGIERFGKGVLKIALAIGSIMLITGLVSKLVKDVPTEKIDKAIDALKTVSRFIGAIMLISAIPDSVEYGKGKTKFSWQNNNKAIKEIRKLIVATSALMLSVGVFARMVGGLGETEFAQAERALRSTLSIVGLIAIICTTISAVASKAGKSDISFSTFTGIVLLIGALIGSIAVLMFMFNNIDWENDKAKLTATAVAFGGISLAIIGILAQIAKIETAASKKKSKWPGILSFTALVGVIGGLLYLLINTIPQEELGRAGAIAAGLLSVIGIISYIMIRLQAATTKNLSTTKRVDAFKETIKAVEIILFEVAGLAGMFKFLEGTNAGRMWGQATALIAILAAVGAIVEAVSYFSRNKKFKIDNKNSDSIETTFKNMGKLLVAFSLLAGVFALIRDVNAGRMWGQATALIAILTAVGAITEAIQYLSKDKRFTLTEKSAKNIKETFKYMGILLAEFAGLALVMYGLRNVDAGRMIGQSQTIILVLAEFAAITLAIQKFSKMDINQNNVLKTFIYMGALLAGFAGVAAILYGIRELNAGKMIAQSQVIVLVLAEFAAIGIATTKLMDSANWATLAKSGVALAGMTALFMWLANIFKIIDGFSSTGGQLIGKSQTIMLVMAELVGIIEGMGALVEGGGIFVFGAIAELALWPMIALFKMLAQVFITIDGLKTDGIMAKSQTIILVMTELVGIIALMGGLMYAAGEFALGGLAELALWPMINLFGLLAQVFITIDGLKTDGIMAKSQTIILVMTELVGIIALMGLLIPLMALGGLAELALWPMITLFDQLTIVFTKIDQLGSNDLREKAQLIVETLLKLEGLSAIGGLIGTVLGPGLIIFAAGLTALGEACNTIGGALILVSTGLTSLSASVMMLTSTGPAIQGWFTNVANGVTILGSTIMMTVTGLATSVVSAVNILIVGVISAIKNGKALIFSEVETIGPGIEKTIKSKLNPLKWGKELIDNYVKGIRSGIAGVAKAAADVAHTIWEYLHFSGGPEKGDIAGMALKMFGLEGMETYVQGWKEGMPELGNVISGAATMIKDGFSGIDVSGMVDVSNAISGEDTLFGKLNSILQAVGLVKNEIATMTSSWSKGQGTLADYEYQLKTEISKTTQELNRQTTAWQRLSSNGTRSGENAKKKAEETSKKLAEQTKKLDELYGVTKKADDATKDFAESLGDVGEGSGKASKATKEVKDEIADFYDKMEGAISLFQEFNMQTELTSDKLIENMRSQITGMTEWANQIQKLAFMGIDQGLLQQLADMGPQGYEYTNAFVHMTAEQLAEANNLYHQSLMLPAKVTSQVYGSFTVAGRSAASGFLQGMQKEDIKAAAVGFAHDVVDQMNLALDIQAGVAQVTYEDGVAVVNGVKTGMNAPYVKQNLDTAIKLLSENNIKGGFEKGLFNNDQMYNIGANITKGIAKGVESDEATSELRGAVIKVCNEAVQAAKSKKATDEHSPSRIFQQIGKFITLGLAKGITDETSSATQAITNTSTRIIDQMRETIDKANAALMDDVNDPVIKPVLDLSNIQTGSRTLNSMLSSNRAMMASASIQTNLQNAQLAGPSTVNALTDNTDVVTAINALQGDVLSLKDAMTNIKMVLDTGTMVGAMTPQIDQQLGNRRVLAGRGI